MSTPHHAKKRLRIWLLLRKFPCARSFLFDAVDEYYKNIKDPLVQYEHNVITAKSWFETSFSEKPTVKVMLSERNLMAFTEPTKRFINHRVGLFSIFFFVTKMIVLRSKPYYLKNLIQNILAEMYWKNCLTQLNLSQNCLNFLGYRTKSYNFLELKRLYVIEKISTQLCIYWH